MQYLELVMALACCRFSVWPHDMPVKRFKAGSTWQMEGRWFNGVEAVPDLTKIAEYRQAMMYSGA